MTVKKKPVRKKRRLRRSIKVAMIVVLALLVAGISLLVVPRAKTTSKLKTLGYEKDAIVTIRERKMTKMILDENLYSPYLAQSLANDTLNEDYLVLYTVVDPERGLTDQDFLLFNRLKDKGYEEDQLINLFKNLQFFELTPLLIFDYQWDETTYIDDCLNNRSVNSENSFTLTNDYLTKYKIEEAMEDESESMLVNSRYYLSQDFKPSGLKNIDTQYAADNMKLTKAAMNAFEKMAADAIGQKKNFFASVSYRSYKDQASAYNSMEKAYGSEKADTLAFRAGHSEHQSGLAVNISATFEDNENFEKTAVYQWVLDNCTRYGFIQRYPAAKACITGTGDEIDHFRYLGTELAKKVSESHLTYDEYYCLFLKPWDTEESVPSTSVLEATGAIKDLKIIKEKPETSEETTEETE